VASRAAGWDQVELTDQRACLGRLFFKVPGGIAYGQYWLDVKFKNGLVRVPFRILTKEEDEMLEKNYRDIKKQVDEAFKPKAKQRQPGRLYLTTEASGGSDPPAFRSLFRPASRADAELGNLGHCSTPPPSPPQPLIESALSRGPACAPLAPWPGRGFHSSRRFAPGARSADKPLLGFPALSSEGQRALKPA
jgi:hypothetical protein